MFEENLAVSKLNMIYHYIVDVLKDFEIIDKYKIKLGSIDESSMGFQYPSNNMMYTITNLHNFIMMIIVAIVAFTLFAIVDILIKFSYNYLYGTSSYISSKTIYDIAIAHNTKLEVA
jgi:hypothetical protein